MIPNVFKSLFVPGSTFFFLLAASVGVLLLYGGKAAARAGRILLTMLVAVYWLFSTPVTAVALVRALTPDHPPVFSRADARGATAVVVLGSGMHAYRSRGALINAATREHAVRLLEAARVYEALDDPWVIVSGRLTGSPRSEAFHMAQTLERLGVPPNRVVLEEDSRNTRDHARLVPPLLAERAARQFVLVTSRQHMTRALMAFRAVGLDPVPSSPDFYVPSDDRGPLEPFLPSAAALDASTSLVYDLLALAYYRIRGWL